MNLVGVNNRSNVIKHSSPKILPSAPISASSLFAATNRRCKEKCTEGILLYLTCEYDDALKCFLEAATHQYVAAFLWLGLLYSDSNWISGKNDDESKKWFQKCIIEKVWFEAEAKDTNNLEAVFCLGLFHEKCSESKKSFLTSLQYYNHAAKYGYAPAQFRLACCFEKGTNIPGIEKNDNKAFEWTKKAADQDYADAQYRLALFFYNAIGTQKDFKKSVEYCVLAMKQGHPQAQTHLENLADKENDIEAQFNLGIHFVKINKEKSIKYFKLAAEQNHKQAFENLIILAGQDKDQNAQIALGNLYRDGLGVKQDYKIALEWYTEASKLENDYAQVNIGYFYQYGLGVSKDLNEAVKLYKSAAEKGNTYARYLLGLCYCHGQGVEKDLKKSIEHYEMAGLELYVPALEELGWYYYTGLGVQRDVEKAKEYFEKSLLYEDFPGEADFAKYWLGFWYLRHQVVEKSLNLQEIYRTAIDYFQKVHSNKFLKALANYYVGVCYHKGYGVTKDIRRAHELFRSAFENSEKKLAKAQSASEGEIIDIESNAWLFPRMNTSDIVKQLFLDFSKDEILSERLFVSKRK